MGFFHYLSGALPYVSVGPTATAFEAQLQVAIGDCQGGHAVNTPLRSPCGLIPLRVA